MSLLKPPSRSISVAFTPDIGVEQQPGGQGTFCSGDVVAVGGGISGTSVGTRR